MSHLRTPEKFLHYKKSLNPFQRKGKFVEMSVNGMEQDCLLRGFECPGQRGFSLTTLMLKLTGLWSASKSWSICGCIYLYFLNFCCFYFCQYFCSFSTQELFVDEKPFCDSYSQCDLSGLLKSFIALLEGFSWSATAQTWHRSAWVWNPFTEAQGSGFHARSGGHFSPTPRCRGGNSVVAHNSTPERRLKGAVTTWSSSGTFKNSEWSCWHCNLAGSLTMPSSCVSHNPACCRSFVPHPNSEQQLIKCRIILLFYAAGCYSSELKHLRAEFGHHFSNVSALKLFPLSFFPT